mgnify:CR=1 FL=1
MLEIAIYLVVLIVLIFALVKLIDKFVTPGNKIIFTVLLWVLSLFLGYLIYASVMKPIEFKKEKEARYEVAVKTMLDIKKLQTGYKTVNGKYADTFEELIQFVENGQFEIVSRKDTAVIDADKNRAFGITTDGSGQGGFFKDIIVIDTLGYVTVKDSLFKNSERYKRLNVVKIGEVEVPVTMKTGHIFRNESKVYVFQAVIDKNALLADLDQELVANENKVKSIDEINGDKITLGSLEEAALTGNWPKKYGNND